MNLEEMKNSFIWVNCFLLKNYPKKAIIEHNKGLHSTCFYLGQDAASFSPYSDFPVKFAGLFTDVSWSILSYIFPAWNPKVKCPLTWMTFMIWCLLYSRELHYYQYPSPFPGSLSPFLPNYQISTHMFLHIFKIFNLVHREPWALVLTNHLVLTD